MEYYTSCVAQRTRLRRQRFAQVFGKHKDRGAEVKGSRGSGSSQMAKGFKNGEQAFGRSRIIKQASRGPRNIQKVAECSKKGKKTIETSDETESSPETDTNESSSDKSLFEEIVSRVSGKHTDRGAEVKRSRGNGDNQMAKCFKNGEQASGGSRIIKQASWDPRNIQKVTECSKKRKKTIETSEETESSPETDSNESSSDESLFEERVSRVFRKHKDRWVEVKGSRGSGSNQMAKGFKNGEQAFGGSRIIKQASRGPRNIQKVAECSNKGKNTIETSDETESSPETDTNESASDESLFEERVSRVFGKHNDRGAEVKGSRGSGSYQMAKEFKNGEQAFGGSRIIKQASPVPRNIQKLAECSKKGKKIIETSDETESSPETDTNESSSDESLFEERVSRVFRKHKDRWVEVKGSRGSGSNQMAKGLKNGEQAFWGSRIIKQASRGPRNIQKVAECSNKGKKTIETSDETESSPETDTNESLFEERVSRGTNHDDETWGVRTLDEIEFQQDLIQKGKRCDAVKVSQSRQHIYFLSSDDEYEEHEMEDVVGVEMKTVKDEVIDEDDHESNRMFENQNVIDYGGSEDEAEEESSSSDELTSSSSSDYKISNASDDSEVSKDVEGSEDSDTSGDSVCVVKNTQVKDGEQEPNDIFESSSSESFKGDSSSTIAKIAEQDPNPIFDSLHMTLTQVKDGEQEPNDIFESSSSESLKGDSSSTIAKIGEQDPNPIFDSLHMTVCEKKESEDTDDHNSSEKVITSLPAPGCCSMGRSIVRKERKRAYSTRMKHLQNQDDHLLAEEQMKKKHCSVIDPDARRRLPPNAKDDYCLTEERPKVNEVENVVENIVCEEEREKPVKRERDSEEDRPVKRIHVSTSNDDVLGTLLDSIMDKGECNVDDQENLKNPSPPENVLPQKFRFGDEDDYPPEEESSEFDLMVEDLFAELNYCLELDEMGSYEKPMAENEENDDVSDQSTLCRKGKHHDLYLNEQIGMICSHCDKIVVEIRHVMPELVLNPSKRSMRKSDCRENESFMGDFNLEASTENVCYGTHNLKKGTVWDVVPNTREHMYTHQVEGVEFLWKNLAGTTDLVTLAELKNLDSSGGGGCIISHAPGTGKTRLTIVFLETLLKLFPYSFPVIIAPASMLLTWEEEWKKWKIGFPFYNLNNLDSSAEENNFRNKDVSRGVKMHKWVQGRSILGASYSLYEKIAAENLNKKLSRHKKEKVNFQNIEKMKTILLEKPGVVVLDEGHTPRNQNSSIWNTLQKLKTHKRVILSGTPFQNNFGELFNTLRLVRPAAADLLGNEKSFVHGTQSGRRTTKKWESQNYSSEAIEKLKAAMAPFVHVHKGHILRNSLPGLKECVVLLNPPPLQKKIVERIESSPNTFEFEHKVALVSVHPSLLQYCSNLSTQEKCLVSQEDLEKRRTHPFEGVKTAFVMELVRLSLAMGEKVLVFSQYMHPLELLKEHIKEMYNWEDGKQVLLLKGKQFLKHRQKLINDFNDPKSESKVLLASTKCCSEGINLIGASRVVLLDVVWNPSVERQAISRAYRLGQKKVVYTYHLMTAGTTEGEKYCTQVQKDRLSELVFSSTSAEENKQKAAVVSLDDKILEEMVGHEKMKDMFKKVTYQLKNTNLIESFSES